MAIDCAIDLGWYHDRRRTLACFVGFTSLTQQNRLTSAL
jgi:hypothetical protein